MKNLDGKIYIPRSLRPEPPPPPQDEVTYACGYKYGVSYGMFAGPSPRLEDMLNIVPKEDRRAAYILRFEKNGMCRDLYRWVAEKMYWRKVQSECY